MTSFIEGFCDRANWHPLAIFNGGYRSDLYNNEKENIKNYKIVQFYREPQIKIIQFPSVDSPREGRFNPR